MSIMTWYPLAQSGSTPSAGDELFEFDSQSAGWPLWSFGSADGHGTHSADGHGTHAGSSDEQAAVDLVLQQQCTQPADDIFMYVYARRDAASLSEWKILFCHCCFRHGRGRS